MEIKLEEIATPKVANFLRARMPKRTTFTKFPVSAFSDDELRKVGEQYGADLIKRAAEQREEGL